jgi:hypothetical protein
MGYYQAVAEKGPTICQDSAKLVPCGGMLASLPRGDGVVFMDAHPGNSINGLRSINPAIMDNDPGKINPALDPFNPKNGFNPAGPSNYGAGLQGAVFPGASGKNEPSDRPGARQGQAHEGRQLPIYRRRRVCHCERSGRAINQL